MINEEIYNENGLQIIFSSYDVCSYTLRTSLYSVFICEDYDWEYRNWNIIILDRFERKELLTINTIDMPEFLHPITGSECRKLKTAEKVDGLIGRLLSIKCFL